SLGTAPRPSGEPAATIPSEDYSPPSLRELAGRPHRDIRDFQIQADGYVISLLTPPSCYALDARQGEVTDGWFLWGAVEGDYPPVLAVHVQGTKRSSRILWPVGAIARVARGAASVFGSIVGTVADGVTGGGSGPEAVREARLDHYDVRLTRDGRLVEPILCQCSGHTYDKKQAAFVPRNGSKAAFFYYGWRTFESAGERIPEIVLQLHDPTRPDEPVRAQVPRKMLEMIAADFEPIRRRHNGLEPAATPIAAEGAASPNPVPRDHPTVLLVQLKGGSILRAAEVEVWGPRDVRIVLEAGERVFVPEGEIRSVRDELGNDWAPRILTSRGRTSKER
ncbi:MAG: hypothetical protein ACREDF_04620, partial [Thermoplasmata archaeon]